MLGSAGGGKGGGCGVLTCPPTHLEDREMGEGDALGLGTFSIPAAKLYNHPVRSRLSLEEDKKLASGYAAIE